MQKSKYHARYRFTAFITALCGLFLLTSLSGCAQDTAKDSAESHVTSSKISKSSSTSSQTSNSSSASSSSSTATSQQPKKSTTQLSTSFNSHNGLTTVANQEPLNYKNKRQMEMASLDQYGRAVDSHIQLNNSEEPDQAGKKREALTLNPAGWHNYNFYYTKDGVTKRAWLMNRGHLVGYQFSGLNDEARNLVVETAYFNAGNYKGMDSGRAGSMLYFENALDSWVANHPNYRLDYQVTPMYKDNELVPREIRLAYVGYDQSGDKLAIKLGSDLEHEGNGGATVVYLKNDSPNAKINYATGTATNTVAKAKSTNSPAATHKKAKSSSVVTATNSAAQTTVYVTGGGDSNVYWYSKDNMPANTNMNNVVTMTQAQAEAAGKRHSLRE
ncbi:DNA/RNA non-specific endonuclease [Periweissella cryptocerci]|uniref:DNA/RNA non-specific endonuclease n=1 Tax=Periweissella cryptocerci TaxID=2506420 RepID=A0A4P6YV07_9LACO|nr:DNA/RNA non-specific endonuclease [Periweissella cryptocerci]QBO36639.1 DNA/RNA non-specific endonuclease [Periweissella cryptocerci]